MSVNRKFNTSSNDNNNWTSIQDEEIYDTIVNYQFINNSQLSNSHINDSNYDEASLEQNESSNEENVNSSMHLRRLFKEEDAESVNDIFPIIQARDSHTLLKQKQQGKLGNIKSFKSVTTQLPPERKGSKTYGVETFNSNQDIFNTEEVQENSVKLFILKRTEAVSQSDSIPQFVKKSNISTSKTNNSNNTNKKNNKTNHTYIPLKQRAMELHSYRVLVEQRRLELLELKIQKERESIKRNQFLYSIDVQDKICDANYNSSEEDV